MKKLSARFIPQRCAKPLALSIGTGLLALLGTPLSANPGEGEQRVAATQPIAASFSVDVLRIDARAGAGFSKSSAVLGGVPSELEMLMSQQAVILMAIANAPAAVTGSSRPPFALVPSGVVTMASSGAAATDMQRTGYVVRSARDGNEGAEQPGSSPARMNPGTGRMNAPDVFGSFAMPVRHTALDAKWRSVEGQGLGRGPWTVLIRAEASEDRLAQVTAVNRWVNARISFASDISTQGKDDDWAGAARSLSSGRGDCEDYAITKLQILRAMGFSEDDLYLVIARDLVRRADHAVLAVRIDGELMVLDSETDVLLDGQAAQDYRPIFSYSGHRAWVHGYRKQPTPMLLAAEPAPRPMQVASR